MNQSSNFYAKAAIVLGIITIVTTIMATLYIPFITGSMAILFALLWEDDGKQCARLLLPVSLLP